MANKLKIIHVSGAKGWGGNEQQIINILPEMNSLNVESFVFGMHNSDLEQECIKIQVDFFGVNTKKLQKFANYKVFKKVFDTIQPDIIHLHTSDALTFFFFSDLIYHFNAKVIFSKKGMGKSSSFLSKIKYNYRGIDAVICVSEYVRSEFSEIIYPKNHHKLTVIHDCITIPDLSKDVFSIREKFKIPETTRLIGHIANHSDAKDLTTLFKTIQFLVQDIGFKNLKLIQIGEKTKHTEVFESMIEQNKMQDYFLLLDKIPNAVLFNKQFDVFVMTSKREGGPTSMLEAMWMQKAIVATRVGVVSEVIFENQNGFVSNVGDYKNLAQNMNELLCLPERAAVFGQNSKEIIERNFLSSKIAQKTYDFYHSLVAKN
jgi:L-malate glycosyltransferase